MADTAAALKSKNVLDEILAPAAKVKSQEKKSSVEANARFADIASNPFYSTVFSENLSQTEKNQSLTALLTDTGVKDQNKANTQAYETFKEWMQYQRQLMAEKIISMSDTKNFSLLRDIYEDINKALDNFENDIEPLTSIIDALFKLRSSDKTVEALNDIKNEKAQEEIDKLKIDEMNGRFETIRALIDNIQKSIAEQKQDKSLFGFGAIKKTAQVKISQLEIDLANANASLEDLNKEYETFNNELASRHAGSDNDPEIVAAKSKLRELLDISSPAHEARSKRLIDSALNFIRVSDEKVAQVRNHLGNMDNQISNLGDTNTQMTYIYAMLNDATDKAEQKNQEIRSSLATPKDGESTIDSLTRTNHLRDLDEHITYLDASKTDTVATMADLGTATIRIKGMEDANRTQMQKAKDMQARGVAGVADRISTVIQAVGAAAISESSNMVGQNLARISDSTNTILHKDSMRNAMELDETNANMLKAIENLKTYGKVEEAATSLRRNALSEMRENLDVMQDTIANVAKSVSESYAAASDVITGNTNTPGSGTLKKNNPTSNDVGFKKII